MISYLPFEERKPDLQYGDLVGRIIKTGTKVETQMEEPARMILGHQMRFDLRNGFPIITERDIVSRGEKSGSQFEMALGELFAFLHGAQTLEEMKRFGCGWWSQWVSEKKCAKRGLKQGDLGPGSYGAAWRRFPTLEGDTFDQIKNLIEQMQELPNLRTHFVSPWIPQYIFRGNGKQQKVVVVPCHGWFHVFINTEAKEISLHHFQRSADVLVGLAFNLVQYAALTLMLAQIFDLKAKELVYTISDAHIYTKQIKDAHSILGTDPQKFPTVTLDPSVKNIFDFRHTHFSVTDYYPQLSRRRIWTPV